MVSWGEFANADPGLADLVRGRFEGKVVFQATTRLDGAPRVHPVSPWFAAGFLVVSCRSRSPKVEEFARDGRYAMHSTQPADDHQGEEGECLVTGWMERLSDLHPAVLGRPYQATYPLATFACSVEEVVVTTYEGDIPTYRRWRA
jgi:hypothetical protein